MPTMEDHVMTFFFCKLDYYCDSIHVSGT